MYTEDLISLVDKLQDAACEEMRGQIVEALNGKEFVFESPFPTGFYKGGDVVGMRSVYAEHNGDLCGLDDFGFVCEYDRFIHRYEMYKAIYEKVFE